MGLNIFTISFKDLRIDNYLRVDVKYHMFINKSSWRLFDNIRGDLVPFKDILINDYKLFNYKTDLEYMGIPTGQTYIDEDGEIIDHKVVTSDDHPDRLKYKVNNENILISSLRLAKTPALFFENEDLSNYVFSNGFYIFKVKQGWNSKFITYVLRTKKLKEIIDQHIYRGIGISAYKCEDLLKILIPNLNYEKQNKIISEINIVENRIKELKTHLISPQTIINNVFSKTFNFDKSLFDEFGKGMTAGTQSAVDKKLRIFFTSFSNLAKSKIFRFSTRYHNPPTKELTNVLSNFEIIRVKDIIDSYEKGVQPIYSQDGEIPVIKIANLKNGYIDLSETELVKSSYFRDLSQNKKLKINDIILCSTGKISLGKIDIFKHKIDAITTVDNYILRLKKNYSPLFFTYFFRCILGAFQIERDFTGATNQIHLYWEQISNFQIPDLPLNTQLSIVKEIEDELKKQDDIKRKITFEREKIDHLIEEAIKQ